VFGEEAGKKLVAAGLHVDPDIVRGFWKISQSISEDKLRGVGSTGPGDALSRDDLEAMMKDPRYSNPAKRDATFVRRVEEGFQRLAAN